MIAAIKGAFMITRGAWFCAAVAVLSVLTVAFAIGLSSGAIAAPGDTARVSVSSAGVQGNLDNTADDVTPTGRFVSFSSWATTLGQDPPGSYQAVYLRDRDTDTDGLFDEAGAVDTQLASVPGNGPGSSGDSFDSSLSSDARYVAFTSKDVFMTAGDTNNASDIIIRDRVGATTTRVSVSTAGAEAIGNSSLPSISRDGRFVAFCSSASNLVATDTNARDDVFLRDRDTDADGIFDEPTAASTVRVSEALGGGDANGDSCIGLRISGDGQFVVFGSRATNLIASDTNSKDDAFIWNRPSGVTERISVSSGGAPGNGPSSNPALSNDGRYVVFTSASTNLVSGDNNNWSDIFLRDRMLGTTERVNIPNIGGQAYNFSDKPTVSDDGRYVAFESLAVLIFPAPPVNNYLDVFVKDRQTSGVYRASGDTVPCGGDSLGAEISGNGLHILFSSDASNLVAGDTNTRRDAFVHENGANATTTLCTTPTPSPTPMPGTPIPAGGGSAGPWTPATAIKLCNGLPATGFGDGSVNGNPSCADVTSDGLSITNTLPSGALYFSSMVTFVPVGGTPAAGAPGSLAGGARSAVTVGVLNAPCNVAVNEDFVLYNVPLPDNTSDPRLSTNIVYPMAIGTTDRFSKWKVGSAPTGADPSGIDTGADPNYAVGTSLAFNNYPSLLLDALDPDFVSGVSDGPAPPRSPEAVYGALTNFSGQWRPLFLVKLAPYTMPSPAGAFTAPFPAGVAAKPAMGSPVMWVAGDPTDYAPTPDNLTDTCSPSVTTITLTGNTTLATGTNYYLQYLSSLRDTDQDSFENAIDTCPVNLNAGSPRVALSGDADNDGLDSACDPNDNLNENSGDFDSDGLQNRGDSCALVANSSQVQSERGPAADKGPITDNIGDSCDSESGSRSLTQNGVTVIVSLSDAVANGRYMTVTNVVAKCVGQTDADGDGYCAAQDMGADGGTCATQAPPSCTSRHLQWAGATFPALQMDTDGDKVADALETYVGTDPVQSCSASASNNNEPMDNWMFDLNDNFTVSGHDTGPFGGAGGGFGKNVVNGPYNGRPGVRYDFNVDGIINGQDTAKFGGVGPYGGTGPFNRSCPPGAGTPVGIPPFYQQ